MDGAAGTQDGNAGSGGGGAGGAGGVGGVGGVGGAVPCMPGDRVCDGPSVRTCDAAGKPSGPALEVCVGGTACSFGRCTTPECAKVERTPQAAIGCLFYGLDTDMSTPDDPRVFGFPVANPGSAPVPVRVLRKATGPDPWAEEVAAVVPSGEIAYLRIAAGPVKGKDWHIEGSGREFKAYRVESQAPIVVYQVNSDDEGSASKDSGSSLVLPVQALGQQYYALALPDSSDEKLDRGDNAYVSIVAVRNMTTVELTVSGKTVAGAGLPPLSPGETYTAVLNEGEVLQVETVAAGEDLAGSQIRSDRPVAVYAGNVCGRLVDGGYDCDHIVEAMYPVTAWGKSFVFLDMRIPPSIPSKSIVGRMVASEDSTNVMFDAPRVLPGLPSAKTLSRGQVFTFQVTDSVFTGRAHFAVHADKPIALESFMGAQEGAAIVVPVEQFLDNYLLSAHPWFSGFLMVTRSAGTPVTLDGMPMPDSVFTPAGSGFEVSFVGLPNCTTDITQCDHRVAGSRVGVTVTANGGVCNYCYSGGAGAACVNRTAGCL